jgi:hypothetical protein
MMAKILTHPKFQFQPWHLKLETNPLVEKVFENAISNLACTGNRKALRKGLRDFVELWIKEEQQICKRTSRLY